MKLRCEDCGWKGDSDECRYHTVIHEHGSLDTVREDNCPNCNGVNLIPASAESLILKCICEATEKVEINIGPDGTLNGLYKREKLIAELAFKAGQLNAYLT